MGEFTSYIYAADYCRRKENGVLEETPKARADVSSHIRSLYDAGVPIYSKEMIRDVVDQLQSGHQKVLVRGLDGNIVGFHIETGQISDSIDGFDFVIGAPFIMFVSPQALIHQAFGYVHRIAYCSLQIFHNLEKRHRLTNEIVHVTPRLSPKQAEDFFETNKQAWATHEVRGQLQSMLSSKSLSHVNKIVAFACGTMALTDQESWSIRSTYQHALITTLRDDLSELQQTQHSIQCCAQDPAYTDTDRDILQKSGINVLDNPQGFLEVDDSTVVLSFGAEVPVRQIIADIARPAMMIWDRSQYTEDELNKTDPDSPRLTEMIQNFYEEIDFPGDLDAFNLSAVYVRRKS
ncbi:uncharacterized protein Z518_06326 [Rhinocladiella mackenziei CBS 650.93]|uniref:SRR1-like domain-containing protein n=1 Tax=Rhinocladiella mackenziei CBS 650.93 TaxID=1442369 RepID=A0A0D2II81_9EURO|nr:uncharacterized protein Z518_06326 [Rhinocladiella mackenziei CBS 650.93]KIX05454.1 hypothetical protein Z518_06326 [Rhinocladiella mackenziei CBS 650.93]